MCLKRLLCCRVLSINEDTDWYGWGFVWKSNKESVRSLTLQQFCRKTFLAAFKKCILASTPICATFRASKAARWGVDHCTDRWVRSGPRASVGLGLKKGCSYGALLTRWSSKKKSQWLESHLTAPYGPNGQTQVKKKVFHWDLYEE